MYEKEYSSLGKISRDFYKLNNKVIQDEVIITKQNKDIDKLKNELIKKYQENADLKVFRKNCINLEEQVKMLEKDIKKLNNDKLYIIKKRDENSSLLKSKISELETVIELKKLDYDKNTVLYKQKMSIYNQLLKENEIYSEEVGKLKNDLDKFEEKKKEELQKQKIESLLKYEKLKKKMLDTIKQSNEEASKLNMEYMDVNNKLSILQNKQLMLYIKYQKEKIIDLEKKNKELVNKLNEYEKDIDMHKLIEKDLMQKYKDNNNENNNEEKIKYKTFYFKKKKKITIEPKLSLKKFNDLKDKENNKNKIIRSNSTTNFISKPTSIEKRLLSYKKEIKEKQFENENILLANSKLKNQLNIYYNKYKGLFFFLEECLNNFFKDKEIKKNKHFLIKLEDRIKMKFDDFNNEEKYSILVLLMKHLLPLVTINFNYKDNIGKELFKTNLNIINKNYSMNKNYLQDKTLKNAFMDNNNKYHNDLHVYKTSYIKSSIPVLRKLQDVELDFYDIKNKAIFY